MIALVSILGVLALLAGAVAVIAVTLCDHAEAVVAALAGRSIRAEAFALPAPRLRVTVRTPSSRRLPIGSGALEPMRAAA